MASLTNPIRLNLEDKNSPLTVEAALRQEASAVTPILLNLPNIEKVDEYIAQRIDARIDAVNLNVDSSAGPYAWPFSSADLVNVYPGISSSARDEILRMQIANAAEAVWNYVLGDIFLRASKKDPMFKEQAAYYLGDMGEDGARYERLPLEEKGQAGMAEARVIRSIKSALKGEARGEDNGLDTGTFISGSEPCAEKDVRRTGCWPRTHPFDTWGRGRC